MEAKCYKFGSSKKDAPCPAAMEQLRMMNRMWNELVELDHKDRGQYQDIIGNADEIMSALTDQSKALESDKESIQAAIKIERQKARSNKPDVTALKQSFEAAKTELKDVRQQIKDYKAEARAKTKPQLHDLSARHFEAKKTIRQKYAAMGLYWGNYNATMDSYEVARSKAMKEGAKLRFHRFDGTGRLTCQIQGGMDIESAFNGSTNLLQIDALPGDAWADPIRGNRRKKQRTVCRLRIGSEGREPVWQEIPITIHREIPSEYRIKTVSMIVHKVADKYRWSLSITVVGDVPATAVKRTGVVAGMDIGWRKKAESVRIAYLMDVFGNEHEIVLDKSYLDTKKRIESLQAIRDENFNAIQKKVIAFRQIGNANEWFTEQTANIGQWKAPGRMVALALAWRQNRFEGDTAIVDELESWRRQDKHLWTWQANLREKMFGRRLVFFRCTAKRLAEMYDHLVIEDFDLRPVRKKKTPEEGADSDQKIRSIGNLAAVGLFRQELTRAFNAAGKTIDRDDPAGTTLVCPFCCGVIETDPRDDIMVRCGACGKVYDQDWAACKNLVARRFEASGCLN